MTYTIYIQVYYIYIHRSGTSPNNTDENLPCLSWPAEKDSALCCTHPIRRKCWSRPFPFKFDPIVFHTPLSHPVQPFLPASVRTAATAHCYSLGISLDIQIIYIWYTWYMQCMCYPNFLCIQSKFIWYTWYMHCICIAYYKYIRSISQSINKKFMEKLEGSGRLSRRIKTLQISKSASSCMPGTLSSKASGGCSGGR